MQNDCRENNIISVCGVISSDFTYSHRVYGETFYTFTIDCRRLSDTTDILPVTISERLLLDESYTIGDEVSITGQLRSYNSYYEGKTHLVLTVFAKEINHINLETVNTPNTTSLNGYICKLPIYRTTPFSREICDILLAVNRAYNKSDYIPIICWGRNAKFASTLSVGDNIVISGRMQSRKYHKKIDEDTVIERTAYEVSVSKLELIS